jgi:tRNA U55 pseudouridine synthase TruB
MNKIQKSNLFDNFNGLFLINKPAGISSFDAIRILKNNFFLIK